MAFFGVTCETIDAVRPIPGADRIELATLRGLDFSFVIGKGSFKPGDKCLYLPIDSILPAPLIEKLGLTGKLAGTEKNRVKTAELRKTISQGVVAPIDIVPEYLRHSAEAMTEYLGVTKWDPPENQVSDGILQPLCDGLSEYDIESAQRYQDVLKLLMDQPALITEKIEGCNLSVIAKTPPLYQESLQVACRTNTIKEIEGVKNHSGKPLVMDTSPSLLT